MMSFFFLIYFTNYFIKITFSYKLFNTEQKPSCKLIKVEISIALRKLFEFSHTVRDNFPAVPLSSDEILTGV